MPTATAAVAPVVVLPAMETAVGAAWLVLSLAAAAVESSAEAAGGGVVGGISTLAVTAVDAFCVCLCDVEVMLEKAQALLYRFPDRFALVDRLVRAEASSSVRGGGSGDDSGDDEYRHKRGANGLGGWREKGVGVWDEEDRRAIFAFRRRSRTERTASTIHRRRRAVGAAEAVKATAAGVSRGLEPRRALEEEEWGARPVEREYVIRSVVDLGIGGGGGVASMQHQHQPYELQPSAMTTMRMGCLVHEAETFPLTRSLRLSLGFEQSEFR